MFLRVEDINQKSNGARLTLQGLDSRMSKIEEVVDQTMACVNNINTMLMEQVRLVWMASYFSGASL